MSQTKKQQLLSRWCFSLRCLPAPRQPGFDWARCPVAVEWFASMNNNAQFNACNRCNVPFESKVTGIRTIQSILRSWSYSVHLRNSSSYHLIVLVVLVVHPQPCCRYLFSNPQFLVKAKRTNRMRSGVPCKWRFFTMHLSNTKFDYQSDFFHCPAAIFRPDSYR